MTKCTRMSAAVAIVAGLFGWVLNPTTAAAEWNNWSSHGGVIVGTPSCVNWGPNRIDCFARGSDNQMHQRFWDGTSWGGWAPIGGDLAGDPTCVGWGPGRIDCFARTSTNAIAHRAFNNGWQAWETFANTASADVSCTAWNGRRRMDCFSRNASGMLVQRTLENGSWGSWEDRGGSIAGTPDCVSWEENRLDCFARGTSGSLQHWWWERLPSAQIDTGWEDLRRAVKEEPSCVSWSAGRLDCFVRGIDDAMHHWWWQKASTSGWESKGGTLRGAPSCTSWGPNRLDCFVRGATNGLEHLWWDNGWGSWEILGNTIQDRPNCTSWGPNRIDCFARASDNTMQHLWWNPGLTGYEVRQSPVAIIGPNQPGSSSIECPSDKVALGAGYKIERDNDRIEQLLFERRVQITKAAPVWPASGNKSAVVEIVNYNDQPAKLTVFAVCVHRQSWMRILPSPGAFFDVSGASVASGKGRVPLSCGPGEVAIGGGLSTLTEGWFKSSAPKADGTGWNNEVIQSGFAVLLIAVPTLVCAPSLQVPQHMVARSGTAGFAGLQQTLREASCTKGMPLAAGVTDTTALTGINMVPVTLMPSNAAQTSWSSKIHNRDIFGGTNSVVAELLMVCAAASR